MDFLKAFDVPFSSIPATATNRYTALLGLVGVFIFSQLFLLVVGYSRKKPKAFEDIPGPSGWPFIGIGLNLPAHPRGLLNAWTAKYGDTIKVQVGWYNWVFFNSRDAIKQVFDRQVNSRQSEEILSVYFLILIGSSNVRQATFTNCTRILSSRGRYPLDGLQCKMEASTCLSQTAS